MNNPSLKCFSIKKDMKPQEIIRDKKQELGELRNVIKTFKVTPSEDALIQAAKDYGFPLATLARHGLVVLLQDPEYGEKVKRAAIAIKALQG